MMIYHPTSRSILGILMIILMALISACQGPGAGHERGDAEHGGRTVNRDTVNGGSANGETMNGKQPLPIAFRVVASEKTLPADFTSVAPEDVLIRLATNDDDLKALWSYFGLRSLMPSVPWDREFILFLGTGEPSNCPLHVKGITFDRDRGRLKLHLEKYTEPGSVCYADFSPRTFALALPREPMDSGWREVQVLGVPREPVVPLETP